MCVNIYIYIYIHIYIYIYMYIYVYGEREREIETWNLRMATHSSILTWKIPWTEPLGHGVLKSQTLQSKHKYTCKKC